jgi:outer membrane protein OmpA-like peptidoglycan-associated protein
MRYIKPLYTVLLVFVSFFVKAQQYDGELQFVGRNFANNKPLSFTKIKVVTGTTTVEELFTKDNNDFKTTLEYGKIYDIYFSNPRCQTMFIRVYADGIPENKRHYRIKYALDIPFFPKDASKIDTSQFINPFHQIVFDGKSKFVDDTTYMNSFLKRVYKKEPALKAVPVKTDTTVPFITTEKLKEYVQLAGVLKLDNDKQTPVKNKPVNILNKKGEVIASTQTGNNGVFVFQNIDSEMAEGINVTLNAEDNPANSKVKLQNSSNETVLLSTSNVNNVYSFAKDANNNIIEKLVDNDFMYNIAGKLVSTNGTVKKVMADKSVYLLNNKNSVIQKVKTNALGNFLFTKIVPGQQYNIAYDSADAEEHFIMNLFSTKDKFIRRIDSVSNKKFIYKFLAVSTGSGFTDLVIDDADLKMNVKGKLFGDNKNNPLAGMKVMLLNDKFETIDSAMTNKDGDFMFKHLPYTKQILFTAENEKNILESFNNILVFDNEDNLIKLVSLVKGHRFNYKPLSTEQSLLSEVYVDDPWLSVMEREKNSKEKATETIVENILFEFNKAELLPQSQQTLDKVILAMTANKNFKIELSAHSDSKGSDAYNLKLSEQRAASAKAYIISKGIGAERISAKGYGETKLLNNCGNGAICSEDEHAVNRRLEFKLNFN